MWRELIQALHPQFEPIENVTTGPTFYPGAPPEQLADVEQQLGVGLPASLRELLAETNGVHAAYGQPLICSTDEIVRRNLEIRTPPYQNGYMPFDHLLFFAYLGMDGIQFAFPIIQGRIEREKVFEWQPIGDSRIHVANSLRQYIEWQLRGNN